MKSVLTEKINKADHTPVYPRLKIRCDIGLVVLFTTRETGMVVYDRNNTWGVGHMSNSWAELSFAELRGQVILDNTCG